MAGKRKLDFSASEEEIRRELAYLKTLPPPNRAANVKKWTYTGSVSNSSALGYLAFAENEPCSPKEPYPTEPPGFGRPTPATKDWIGPSTPSTIQKNVPRPRPRSSTISIIRTRSQSRSQNPPQWSRVPTMARSGRKKKSPQIVTMPHPTKKPGPADELWCQLCHVICSSAFNMQQHLRGRAHKARMEWTMEPRDSNFNGGGSSGIYACDVCQIRCPDRYALGMHLKGKKHKGKVQEDVDKNRLVRCDACGVHCMNENSFRQHLKGRQHTMKQINY